MPSLIEQQRIMLAGRDRYQIRVFSGGSEHKVRISYIQMLLLSIESLTQNFLYDRQSQENLEKALDGLYYLRGQVETFSKESRNLVQIIKDLCLAEITSINNLYLSSCLIMLGVIVCQIFLMVPQIRQLNSYKEKIIMLIGRIS